MKNDYDNLINILDLFGYSGDGLESFKKQINNQDISSVYKKIIMEDKRFIVKIEDEHRQIIDSGWKLFQKEFKEFCEKFSITYTDFTNNSFKEGKQTKKLFKSVKLFYPKFKLSTEGAIERISSLCLPKKDLFYVFSVNLNDFILCSTKNSWTSCLDFNGGSFWSSLSGFLVDKNRAIIYVSDLEEKNYKGIESYKMYDRSWCLLDSNNDINVNISYPKKEEPNVLIISKIFGIDFKTLKNSFKSKFLIKPIFNDNKVFPYGYQDNSSFILEENGARIKGSDGYGCYAITKNFFGKKEIERHDDLYLVEEDSPINIKDTFMTECELCGKKESSNICINDTMYCKECFDKEKIECFCCGKSFKEKFITTDNEVVCRKCKKKEEYTKCIKCNKYHSELGELCENCLASSEVFKCIKCMEYFDSYSIYDLSKTMFLPVGRKTFIPIKKIGIVCDDCFEDLCVEEKIVYCENCGKQHEDTFDKKCNNCGESY